MSLAAPPNPARQAIGSAATRTFVLAAVCALAAACATTPAADPSPLSAPHLTASQQRGHDFAVRRCGGCHNVGADDGAAAEGPAFRLLGMRYNALALERRFAEVSAHGADRMPPISFTRGEAEDLIDYINTLPPR